MPGNANLGGGVAELVLSAGPIAKVVLSVLAVFSIVCWALIVEKWWEFRRIRRESSRFLRVFRDARVVVQVEQDVVQTRADEAAEERQLRGLQQRLRVDPAAERVAVGQPKPERHRRGHQDAVPAERERPDLDGDGAGGAEHQERIAPGETEQAALRNTVTATAPRAAERMGSLITVSLYGESGRLSNKTGISGQIY